MGNCVNTSNSVEVSAPSTAPASASSQQHPFNVVKNSKSKPATNAQIEKIIEDMKEKEEWVLGLEF